MSIWIVGVTLFFTGQLICYVACTPDRYPQPILPSRFDSAAARLLFALAYLLSLLRLPFAVLPYIIKIIGALLRKHYSVSKHVLLFEALRIAGDIVNWGLIVGFVEQINISSPALKIVLYSSIYAEAIRLFTEKGQMLFSASWQFLPHRAIARAINRHLNPDNSVSWVNGAIARYCAYYSLDDEQRIEYILDTLRNFAACNPEAQEKLGYLTSLRIVPSSCGLRGGYVRDVARGEVFIHRHWTSDPWLLIGQALRRTPWMFDPRLLPRPFYYRSQANRLATLFVLCHARYCPAYAIYQFGHEIKSARYDLFYRVLRWLGVDIEPVVQADGTFQFDQGIGLLKTKLNGKQPARQKPLWQEQDVVSDIGYRTKQGEILTLLDIAVQYTYPLKYVEDVLAKQNPASCGVHLSTN